MTRKRAKKEEKKDVFLDLPLALIDKVVSNEDLLIEILLCLPAKSLIKFKFVCKSWLKIISDPKFCYSHTNRAPKVVTRICFYDDFIPKLKSVSLQGYQTLPNLSSLCVGERENKPHLEDICNGLILISGGYMQGPFTVSNLTTQKSISIPQFRSTFNDFLFACLAFDPAKSPFYKVIVVKHRRNPGLYVIDIYSSETKSWQNVEFNARGSPSRNKAYWNGEIHWMNHNNIHAEFDIDNKKLTETPLPENPKIFLSEEIHFFGECNGDLLLIQYKSTAVLGFRILEMKRETRHWVVKRRVNLRPILDVYPDMVYMEFQVLSVVKGSGENDLVLVLASATVFLSYDLRTKAVKELFDDFEWRRSEKGGIIPFAPKFRSFCIHRFFESLFPI